MPKLPMTIQDQLLQKMLGQAPTNQAYSQEMVPANNKSGATEKLYPDYANGGMGPRIPLKLMEKAEAEFINRFGQEPATDGDYREVTKILEEMGYDTERGKQYDSPVDEQINQMMDDPQMMQQLLEQAMGNTDAVVDARSGEPVANPADIPPDVMAEAEKIFEEQYGTMKGSDEEIATLQSIAMELMSQRGRGTVPSTEQQILDTMLSGETDNKE